MLSSTAIEQPKKISIATGISIFAFICLIVEGYFIGKNLGAGMLGNIIGQCMVYSIFAVLIFPRRWLKASSIAIIIPITLCFTAVGSYEVYKHASLESKIKKDGHQLIQVAKNMNGTEVLNNDQIATMNLGIFEDSVKVMSNIKAKIQEISLNYSQFAKLRIKNAFDAKTLADKKLRDLQKVKFAEIKVQMLESKKQIDTLLNNFESDLQINEVPAEVRSSYLSGLKKGVKVPQDFMNEWFELESQTLQTMLNIYVFLDEHDGEFTLVNDQLLFNNDSDRDYLYNLGEALVEISKRQQMLEKIYQEETQSKLRNFESSLE